MHLTERPLQALYGGQKLEADIHEAGADWTEVNWADCHDENSISAVCKMSAVDVEDVGQILSVLNKDGNEIRDGFETI